MANNGQSKDDEDSITDEEDNIDVEEKQDENAGEEQEASISRASSKTQFANFSGQHWL